jgi:probable O-glycosylation ligase (exosortase A-associated)
MIYTSILLFFFLEYVRPNSYIALLTPLRLNSIVPLTGIAASLFKAGKVTAEDLLSDTNVRLIGAFMGLMFLSIIAAEVRFYAFTTFLDVVGYALLLWPIGKEITTLDRLKAVFKVLVFSHILIGLLSPELLNSTGERGYVESGSFLGDGNDFALSVNIVIPLCLFLLLDAKATRHRLVYLGALLFLVVAVVATQSRGGTVALGAVLLYYWAKGDRKILMASICAAVLIAVYLSAPSGYFDRMATIANAVDGSSQGRIAAWKAGMQMAWDHPIFGVGVGNFPQAFGTHYKPPDIPIWMTAHSIYFLVLGELGLPGFTVLLSWFFINLSANRRLASEVRGRRGPDAVVLLRLLSCMSASFIAFASGGAFLSAIYYPHFFILAALALAARRIVRERNEETVAVPRAAEPAIIYHWALAGSATARRLS